MNTQKPNEMVNKAAWTLVEGIKDIVQTDLVAAVGGKQLDIKPEALQRLLVVVHASIEAGFHRGNRVFNREVDAALAQVALPPLNVPVKKKSG